MKGIICSIIGEDYSNGGISSTSEEILLIGSNIPEIFESQGRPVVQIENHYRDKIRAVEVSRETGDNEIGPMFGGSFIWSYDSRFPADYPVPLHDRFEKIK